VKAGTGFLDTPVVDVGGEDLNGYMVGPFARVLREGHSDGIRLLTGRTPQDPNPHRLVVSPAFGYLREDSSLEQFECLSVAEKTRHVYENILIQIIDFLGTRTQVTRIIVVAFDFVEQHAPEHSPLQGT